MALMLLPFFTDGCIGSMEGLYFEASGTTPYHFLTAAAGSKQASNPVRRLAYENNDVDLAVRYMQDLGIRYYLAFRPEVGGAGRRQPGPHRAAPGRAVDDLRGGRQRARRARSPPTRSWWTGMDNATLPLHLGRERDRWLELGTSWFQHPGGLDRPPRC